MEEPEETDLEAYVYVYTRDAAIRPLCSCTGGCRAGEGDGSDEGDDG